MKKRILSVIIFSAFSVCFAGTEELSKQAVAFYNDNNYIKTMDLILQINENERSAEDWLILGNIYADKGQLEDAIYTYKKAVVCDKKCYKALYNLGNYYAERGQFDLALENYKKASKIKADNPYIFYNLGCIYLKKGMLNQARTNFNKAIMYDSKIPEFHYNLAYVYKKLNKDKMAQTYLDNYNKLISE
jgi:tetratricopeptide (TPR) repeat protein